MRPTHPLLVVAVVVATAVAAQIAVPSDPSAATAADGTATRQSQRADAGIRTPGSLTGYAFDTCVSPSGALMSRWWRTSPFSAVGIYLSGQGRACPQAAQPHLSRKWVRHQHADGWRILPIHVGLQAPCFQVGDPTPSKPRMSARPGKAHEQGVAGAAVALRAADRFGIGRGSTIYLDIEYYDRTRSSCEDAVLSFADGWTDRLHRSGFRSGLYSSASAAVHSLDLARRRNADRYDWPDQIWAACGACRPVGDLSDYLSGGQWPKHSLLHQYELDVRESYGGQSYLIDKNWLDVGAGSRARAQTGRCGGRLSWETYPPLSRKSSPQRVAAAKCLLSQQGFLESKVNSVYGSAVRRAVERLQESRGLPVSGVLRQRSWVSLLAAGDRPVVKAGSDQQAVWRLQRALSAAGVRTPLTGVIGASTTRAIKTWQQRVGRARTGVIDPKQWRYLLHGRTGSASG